MNRSGVINTPIPRPISNIYPRRLPSGCIVALDTNSGVPGVPRTNLVPADKVTFAGWYIAGGETITVTHLQAIEGYTANGATRIQGAGNGSNIRKYLIYMNDGISASGVSTFGLPYSFSVVVKNQGLTEIRVASDLAGNILTIPVGGIAKAIGTQIGTGAATTLVFGFYLPLATDKLDIIAYQPMCAIGNAVYEYTNAPAIPAVPTNPLVDLSGLGNNGAVTGAVPVRVSNGLAYSFDGVDDVATITGDMIGVGDATVEIWFNPSSWGEGGFGRLVDNGKFILAIQNSSLWATSNGSTTLDSTNGTLALNTWHHGVITRTAAGAVNLYVNTLAVGNGSGGVPVAGGNTLIGANAAGDRCFAGLIGAVRIYNRILSAQEISLNYNLDCARYGLPAR